MYLMPKQRRWIQVSKMEKCKIWRLNSNPLSDEFESLFQKAEEQESKRVDSNLLRSGFESLKEWIRIPFLVCSKNVSKKTRFESLILRIRIPIPVRFFEDINSNLDSSGLCIRWNLAYEFEFPRDGFESHV